MERFLTPEQVENLGMTVSTMRHGSLTGPMPINPVIAFYRGPLPSTSTFTDSVVNFYTENNFRSQRLFQPRLNGSL
jgi:hypothetical protein